MLRELEGLRALARSLMHGDADADDLLQDTAIVALAHRNTLGTDQPVRSWLATVLRNRWRMDRRRASRRQAREQAVAVVDTAGAAPASDPIDRARTIQKLASALVALDEPFRTAVIRRYLDGKSAAEIARELDVPPATVRSRLKTGLARLRVALDSTQPSWQRVLAPLVPLVPLPSWTHLAGATVKTKTSISAAVVVILLLGAGGAVWLTRDRAAPGPAVASSPPAATVIAKPAAPRSAAIAVAPLRDPLPGQARATVEPSDSEGGVISGRVINWSRGDGVAGAELTFTSDAGASTIRSHDDGTFDLTPSAPGRFVLSAVAAPGFLPYAPELLHSTVHVVLAKGQAVRGITVFLFPALDYHGSVVDAHGAPASGARVRLLGTPAGEQAIDKPQTEWTADRDGHFVFHAADEAILEATLGAARGWARLDAKTMITKQLTIALGDAPARDQTITGRAVETGGAPLADVLIRATPSFAGWAGDATRSTAFATTGADGSFTLAGLDRGKYNLQAEDDDHATASLDDVAGGSHGVTITLDAGLPLSGSVLDGNRKPAPAYTLLVHRREGVGRVMVVARSIVDPRGRFAVRVAKGDYELVASANGWAPSPRTHASAGATDVELVLSSGAVLRGSVVDGADGKPIAYARVMREAGSTGGASTQPANIGTVTRPDGTFELAGVPPGRFSIEINAGDYHPKIEAALTAVDDESLGPITIALSRVAEGEQPRVEVVGIGTVLTADGDALRVEHVVPGGGAAAAGIVAGDRVIELDGAPVAPLGVDGAIGKIRGVAGTTITVTLLRGGKPVLLVVERRKIQV